MAPPIEPGDDLVDSVQVGVDLRLRQVSSATQTCKQAMVSFAERQGRSRTSAAGRALRATLYAAEHDDTLERPNGAHLTNS